MSFESLGLAPALLRALTEIGYATPTPIQIEAIPLAMAGHDLLGGAQTGTGKTAAFALPMLHRLSDKHRRRRPASHPLPDPDPDPRTRRAGARQHPHLRQIPAGLHRDLRRRRHEPADRYPAPRRRHPGRHPGPPDRPSRARHRPAARVEMLILDEADRMLDMGFLPAIKRILNKLPATRQTLLFSATFEDAIKKLAMEFMRNPREVQVAARNTVAETVTHRAHPVDAARKRDLLIDILSERYQDQILVFGKTKHGCNRLAEQLEKSGIKAVAIHGNKSQSQRLKALGDFKSGKARVLVATDVAARGLDIPQLPLVINFDLPMVAEDYVHRIGRTGRAGASGEAISLVSPDEGGLLRAIHRVLKADIEMTVVEGYAPSRQIRMGNDSASAGRPSGQRTPSRRTPHTAAAPRHAQAHAGASRTRPRNAASVVR